MDPTTKVLTAALAYADALIENGPAIHVDVAGELQNLALIPHMMLLDATKGHSEHLQARRDEIAHALETYRANVIV
jgi:hypothetical protein